MKVNQRNTHEKRMVRTKHLVKSYYEIVSRLKSIVAQLDPAQRNVVEFRHRSWWRDKVYPRVREARDRLLRRQRFPAPGRGAAQSAVTLRST